MVASCAGTTNRNVEVADSTTTTVDEGVTTSTPPDCAEILPPAAQAGQLLMVMVTTPHLAEEQLSSGRVGGFGLKGRQADDVGAEVAETVADAAITPFVASDEEGGTVQRLAAALGDLPSAETMAEGSPEDAAATMGTYAEAMVGLGFNMVFGPVADVGAGSDLGTRVFGDDPEAVSSYVDAIIDAQMAAGITPVVKHWPGIGSGGTDPHMALDSLDPVQDLRASDLTVFDSAIAAGVPAIMVAHAAVEGLTEPDEPTSVSRAAITGELRDRQGFDGLVITDSLGMGAIVNTTQQDVAAELAIAAGADVALLSGTDVVEAAHTRLTEAIMTGRIPAEQVAESVRRVLRLKRTDDRCLDIAATFSGLQQELAAEVDVTGGSAPATDDSTTGDSSTTDEDGIADSGINDAGG